MIDTALTLTLLLSYKTAKKYAVSGMERPTPKSGDSIHLRIFIIVGHICFILGQYFLLEADVLVVDEDWAIILVFLSLILSDIQDVLFRKRPDWLFTAIFLEYTFWSSLGIISFLSAQFGEGALFLVASLSRLADIMFLYSSNQGKGGIKGQ